ncbi:hypothetical protein HCI99_06380 [Listeria booriae]|uniref:Uncharacterized protein n=1 Tax=Listeria booriae TaxID=1552123 RepID=A0A7X1CBI1_9LIST|nr:hypothetical protein [Listeria booriae]MBC1491449.1 hypothetical protein [Listeria booriae]
MFTFGAILATFFLIIFGVSLIWGLIQLMRKKNIRKPLLFSGISFAIAIIGIVLVFTFPAPTTTQTTAEKTESKAIKDDTKIKEDADKKEQARLEKDAEKEKQDAEIKKAQALEVTKKIEEQKAKDEALKKKKEADELAKKEALAKQKEQEKLALEQKEKQDKQKASKKDELKSKIDLSSYGDYQFSGSANIKPLEAKIKTKKMALSFEWRNDDGVADKRSFNGSGVTVIAYQNNKELKQLDESTSGASQSIKKNTTLEIDYDYNLIDSSPVMIKMLPLEGDAKEFTFKLTK